MRRCSRSSPLSEGNVLESAITTILPPAAGAAAISQQPYTGPQALRVGLRAVQVLTPHRDTLSLLPVLMGSERDELNDGSYRPVCYERRASATRTAVCLKAMRDFRAPMQPGKPQG